MVLSAAVRRGVAVGAFGVAGLLANVGGLLWTGLYGFPHRGGLGFALVVGALVALTVCAALADGLPDPHEGPPQ